MILSEYPTVSSESYQSRRVNGRVHAPAAPSSSHPLPPSPPLGGLGEKMEKSVTEKAGAALTVHGMANGVHGAGVQLQAVALPHMHGTTKEERLVRLCLMGSLCLCL